MKVFLRDHKLNSWPQAMQTSFSGLAICGSDTDGLPNLERAIAIVFLHTETEATKSAWIAETANSNINVLVLVNTGGRTQEQNPPQNVYPCWWRPGEFTSHPRPMELVRQIKECDFKNVDWSLLQPENSEALLAVNLIVEAKAHEGKSLHGLQIGNIPDELLAAAQAVAGVKAGDTARLQSSIEAFEAILNRITPQS